MDGYGHAEERGKPTLTSLTPEAMPSNDSRLRRRPRLARYGRGGDIETKAEERGRSLYIWTADMVDREIARLLLNALDRFAMRPILETRALFVTYGMYSDLIE